MTDLTIAVPAAITTEVAAALEVRLMGIVDGAATDWVNAQPNPDYEAAFGVPAGDEDPETVLDRHHARYVGVQRLLLDMQATMTGWTYDPIATMTRRDFAAEVRAVVARRAERRGA